MTTDFLFRIPSPKTTDRSRASTGGDSSTQLDQWLWPPQEIYNTPSKKLGLSWIDEFHLRARAVNWIIRICISLQLPQLIIATAAAYVHRFYMRKSLQKYPPKVMSATALFLATKVEEVPRKLEYVVREYLKVDSDGNERPGLVTEDSNEFQLLKEQILYYEDILLRTLCFDLAVDHPYVSLVHNVKLVHESHHRSRSPNPSISVEMADRSKAKSITQAAWGFVNDSLLTPLCLVARPELIAASAFLLAVSHRVSECPLPYEGNQNETKHENDLLDLNRYLTLSSSLEGSSDDGQAVKPWWKIFQVQSLEAIHEVANTMLDQYALSACDYIRGRASKIPRFPGPSLLQHPALDTPLESSPKSDSAVSPTGMGSAEEPKPLAGVDQLPILTTPPRQPMSDSMDLGTPVDSDERSPSNVMISPLSGNRDNDHHSGTSEVPIQQSSRPQDSLIDENQPPNPQNHRLEAVSTSPIKAHHPETNKAFTPPQVPQSTIPNVDLCLPPRSPSQNNDTVDDSAREASTTNGAITNHLTNHSESSLSDMEDGELD